jgi:hypothetical protein
MTLRDALMLVLREVDSEPMTARQLADAVNERGLYRSRGGPRRVLGASSTIGGRAMPYRTCLPR